MRSCRVRGGSWSRNEGICKMTVKSEMERRRQGDSEAAECNRACHSSLSHTAVYFRPLHRHLVNSPTSSPPASRNTTPIIWYVYFLYTF